MSIRLLKSMLLGPFLLVLLLGNSFGAAWWEVPPRGQPTQMWSRVDYDPKLSDPFFKSNEWSCPDGCTDCPTCQDGEPLMKHTAKCFSTSDWTEHAVRFCETRLLDVNMLALLIHESNPEFVDKLTVWIRNGMFTCQYWTGYKGPRIAHWRWTTKRQKLILDKNAYRKGDVIKGRIDFECVQEATNPKYVEKWGRTPKTIKVYGVFKTIVK